MVCKLRLFIGAQCVVFFSVAAADVALDVVVARVLRFAPRDVLQDAACV